MREAFGKRVRVTCVDGDTLEGECENFTSTLDSEDGRESIVILCRGYIEIYEDEIEKIEML